MSRILSPVLSLAEAVANSLMRSNAAPVASLSAPDVRADGGVRHIRLSPRAIRIERQIAGIKMRVAVPLASYRGVVMKSETTHNERLCRIALEHADPELAVELYRAPESPDAWTIWRQWADFFDQPALCENFSPTIVPADCVTSLPRRRGTSLGQRRPRFLKRRRCGREHKIWAV